MIEYSTGESGSTAQYKNIIITFCHNSPFFFLFSVNENLSQDHNAQLLPSSLRFSLELPA